MWQTGDSSYILSRGEGVGETRRRLQQLCTLTSLQPGLKGVGDGVITLVGKKLCVAKIAFLWILKSSHKSVRLCIECTLIRQGKWPIKLEYFRKHSSKVPLTQKGDSCFHFNFTKDLLLVLTTSCTQNACSMACCYSYTHYFRHKTIEMQAG